jgi:hypothetical protein
MHLARYAIQKLSDQSKYSAYPGLSGPENGNGGKQREKKGELRRATVDRAAERGRHSGPWRGDVIERMEPFDACRRGDITARACHRRP